MAKVSRTVCDLHLARGEEVDATTRNVNIDEEKASIDLCDSCYQENIAPVLGFIEQLRTPRQAKKAPAKRATKKVAAKRATKKVTAKGATKKTKKTATTLRRGESGPSPAAIRRWAQEQGIEVRASGRVSRQVRDQYLAAHEPRDEAHGDPVT